MSRQRPKAILKIKKCFLSTGRLGIKPASRTFFFMFQGKNNFFLPLYILVYIQMKLEGKKILTSRQTGNTFLLKAGLTGRRQQTLRGEGRCLHHTYLLASSTWACLAAYSSSVLVNSFVITSWEMSTRLHSRSEMVCLAYSTAPLGSLK